MKEKNNNTEDKSRKVLVTLPPTLYDQLNEQASAQVVNIQE